MSIWNNLAPLRIAATLGLVFAVAGETGMAFAAQAPAAAATPAPANTSQRGTVKTVDAASFTMATDAGAAVTVNVASTAKILQVPVGSVDLKSAKAIQLSEIAAGDHVLVTGKAGETAGSLNAIRVILMKSADIEQKNAAEQADWKARGAGGIVSSVDTGTGAITLTVGAKKLIVNTTSKTDFRRFAGDSVKYQDAKPGTLAQIQVKDQLQARGAKSEDGTTMQAEEVVSGSFDNLSGLLLSVDATAGKITLKDLATKKVYTVTVTANSDQRKMPLQMATMFAARSSNGGAQAGGSGGGAGSGQAAGERPAGAAAGGGARRSAGGDLSQMIGRLPGSTLADLKTGDAVMVVASEPTPGSTAVTAITLLSGVEPILTANPKGGMDLSGWSMSSGPGGTE